MRKIADKKSEYNEGHLYMDKIDKEQEKRHLLMGILLSVNILKYIKVVFGNSRIELYLAFNTEALKVVFAALEPLFVI